MGGVKKGNVRRSQVGERQLPRVPVLLILSACVRRDYPRRQFDTATLPALRYTPASLALEIWKRHNLDFDNTSNY